MSDRLDEAVAALDGLESPVRWTDVERRAARLAQPPGPPPTSGPRQPMGRAAVVVAAAMILAIAGVVVVAVLSTTEPSPVETSAPTVSGATGPSTSTTAPATRSLRTNAVVVVADDRLLVWGGEAGDNDVSARADGFMVDVASREQRTIPAAPIDPRSSATGVWTGSELIVCCGSGQLDGYPFDTRSAAAWNPSTGEWRTLARPPEGIARSFAASVWTGDSMLVVASGGRPAAARYDPSRDEWTDVPAPPLRGRAPDAVWTGDEVVVWDSVHGSGVRPPDGAVADRGWRWSPGDDDWQALPDLPEGHRTELGSMVWSGTEVFVWGRSTEHEGRAVGATWRPDDDGWQPVPDWPGEAVEPYQGTAGSQAVRADGSGMIAVRGLEGNGLATPPLHVYDTATARWHLTSVAIEGHHPTFAIVRGLLLVPDDSDPYAGWLPGYGP